MKKFNTINPYTHQIISHYNYYSENEIERILNKSKIVFDKWRKLDIKERIVIIVNLAKVLALKKNILAELITSEMGKSISEAQSEIEKCIKLCEYYARCATDELKDVEIKTEYTRSFKTYQPLGTILGIMPWNFPFWQAFRFFVPALLSGNVTLLRHASNVTGCAYAIKSLFDEVTDMKDIFQILVIDHHSVEQVIKSNVIKGVSLTGSTEVGKHIAKISAEELKPTVLELGGNDPYIILADANLENASHQCVKSRLINAGQSCIAAKRMIVVEEVFEDFSNKVQNLLSKMKCGDPMNTSNHIGPLAKSEFRDKLHQQVTQSIEKGAKCLLGGSIDATNKAIYPITLLTHVQPGMPAFDEELFGPVISIIKATTIEHAIELANNSCFGLGGAIFTSNIQKGIEIAKNEISSGSCSVNGLVASHPALPFGGINQSGYGRELAGEGLKAFTNLKTITVS